MNNRTSVTDFEPEMIQSKPLTVKERQKLSLIIRQSKAQAKRGQAIAESNS